MLSVLYCLGHSRKKELPPAQNYQKHPQTETLFKCLGLTSQEATRERGKAPNQGDFKWSPSQSQVQHYCDSLHSPYHHVTFAWVLFTTHTFLPESKVCKSWGQACFSSPLSPQSLEIRPPDT